MSAVFDAYARYYDLLYGDKDYAAEAEYVASRIREYLPAASRILELGCGSGAHACHLARMGYLVHGVDSSPAMIEHALSRKKMLAPELATRVSVAQGDIRNLRINEEYDAVISLFHVVSYQTSNADLIAAFKTASDHLKTGGLFLFDFWYGPAVLHQQPETRVKRLEDQRSKIVRLAEPMLHDREDVVDVKFTVLVGDIQTGVTEEIIENHRMRYLFLPEVDVLLEMAGLERVDASAWMERDPPSLKSWGVVVLARKHRK